MNTVGELLWWYNYVTAYTNH